MPERMIMITANLTSGLLSRLDKHVEPGGRSRFIRDAVTMWLALEPYLKTWDPETAVQRIRKALGVPETQDE